MSMTSKTVNLHIGLHKTATTFVQDVLEQNHAEGLANNVLFIPRRRFRSEIRHIVDKANAQNLRELDLAKARLEAIIGPYEKIVISEEGIVGKYKQLIGPQIYPDIDSNLKKWRYMLGDADVNVYISFRNYADLYRSAFSHAISRNKNLHIRTEADVRRVKAQAISAFASLPIHVVDAVVRHFPGAVINIWKFEDFVGNELYYIDKLASFPIARRRYVIPQNTKSPSRTAIGRLIAIRKMTLPGFIKRILSSYALKMDRGTEPFSIFDDKERLALELLFDDDMRKLKTKYPDVVFL